jgi:hypothetical protein
MVNIDFFIRGEDREIFFHSKLGQVATCPCGLRFLWWHLWARGGAGAGFCGVAQARGDCGGGLYVSWIGFFR